MKQIDTQLEIVPGIVTTCIIFHNLCTIQNDEFLKDWIREAQNEVHDSLQDPIFKNSPSQQALADDCSLALGGIERTVHDALQWLQKSANKEFEIIMETEDKTTTQLVA